MKNRNICSRINMEYMNLIASNEDTVEQGRAVKFDDVTSSDGIIYDKENNTIIFTRGGMFFLSWWISIVETSGVEFISSGILNRDNDTIVAGTIERAVAVDISTFTLSGNKAFEARQGEIISLRNIGAGNFRLSRENGFSGQMTIIEMRNTESYISVFNKGDTDMIPQGGRIDMDTVDFSRNITYENGVFTIMNEGEYFVSWLCNIDASNVFRGEQNYVVSLSKNGVQIFTSGMKGSSGIAIYILEGFGVVHFEAGDTIDLRNFSDSDLQFSTGNGNAPVNIFMHEI